MKKQVTYFNYEERNGLFLLCFLLLLFCTFIFLQKRMLPTESHLNVSIESDDSESVVNSTDESDTYSTEIGGDNADRKQETSYIASAPSQRLSLITDKEFSPKSKTNSASRLPYSRNSNVTNKEHAGVASSDASQKAHTSNTSGKKDVRRIWNSDQTPQQEARKYKYKRKQIEPFSINSTDEDKWQDIRGIGPKYAERIVKYQSWLGGFYAKEQLKEVYGITDSLYQTFQHLLVDDKPYATIKINTTSKDELGRHPYIDWKQAQKIIKYRKHHGDFNGMEDFQKVKGLDVEQVSKLEPYLDFQPSSDSAILADLADK